MCVCVCKQEFQSVRKGAKGMSVGAKPPVWRASRTVAETVEESTGLHCLMDPEQASKLWLLLCSLGEGLLWQSRQACRRMRRTLRTLLDGWDRTFN